MKINFHILKASGRIEQYVKEIEKVCLEAEETILAKIPLLNVDVVLVDNPKGAIKEIGMGGRARNPNFVLISLDPDFSDFSGVYPLLVGFLFYCVIQRS